MIEVITIILVIALLLYVLLGGADFGAGIVELFIGKKGINTISKAIAPVWEANHIWLIIAIVILFNGFPVVYTTVSTFLHIPLMLILIGIIVRGTAFTFRYYDTTENVYYSWFFRIASLLTPFFLGMVLGAIILGRIPNVPTGDFLDLYVKPWFNLFSLTTGLFLTFLFGWIASVYLVGEVGEDYYISIEKTSFALLILLVISGLCIFIAAELYGLHLFEKFLHSGVSMACIIIATALLPLLWRNVKNRHVFRTRFLAGVQTTCILIGWFAAQFPVMVYIADGTHLTVWNSHAPQTTIYYLMMALLVGIVIIFPAFGYLFKVFKFGGK